MPGLCSHAQQTISQASCRADCAVHCLARIGDAGVELTVEVLFYKRLSSLVPADEQAKESIAHIAQGECVAVRIRRPRNVGHHRKFFSLLQLVFENQEVYPTLDHFLTAVKIAAGWYEDVPITVAGKLVYIPKSISFERMDQGEFERFYLQAIAAICRLLPQFKAEHLQDAVAEYA